MQFADITLSLLIIDPEQETTSCVSIAATQGEGTGLAYHLNLFPVPGRDPGGYCLTHIQSGYQLCSMSLSSPEQVQIFLERVAVLDPDQWRMDLPTFKKRYPARKHARMIAQITEISTAVLSEGQADTLTSTEVLPVALRGPFPHPATGEATR